MLAELVCHLTGVPGVQRCVWIWPCLIPCGVTMAQGLATINASTRDVHTLPRYTASLRRPTRRDIGTLRADSQKKMLAIYLRQADLPTFAWDHQIFYF